MQEIHPQVDFVTEKGIVVRSLSGAQAQTFCQQVHYPSPIYRISEVLYHDMEWRLCLEALLDGLGYGTFHQKVCLKLIAEVAAKLRITDEALVVIYPKSDFLQGRYGYQLRLIFDLNQVGYTKVVAHLAYLINFDEGLLGGSRHFNHFRRRVFRLKRQAMRRRFCHSLNCCHAFCVAEKHHRLVDAGDVDTRQRGFQYTAQDSPFYRHRERLARDRQAVSTPAAPARSFGCPYRHPTLGSLVIPDFTPTAIFYGE